MSKIKVFILVSFLPLYLYAQTSPKIPFAIRNAVKTYETAITDEREKLLKIAAGVTVTAGEKLPINLSKAVEAYDAAVAKHKAKLLHEISSSKAAIMSKNGNDDDLASLGRYSETLKSQKDLTGRAILEGGKDELNARADKEKEAADEASTPFIGSWFNTNGYARLEILEGGACRHDEFGVGSWVLKNSKIILRWRKNDMIRNRFPDLSVGDATISLVVSGRAKNLLEGTGLNGNPVFFRRNVDSRGGVGGGREYAVDAAPRPSGRRAGASSPVSAPAFKLPVGAQKFVEEFNSQIKKEKEKVLRTLQAELANETKDGDLDDALVLRDAMREFQQEDAYLITPKGLSGRTNQDQRSDTPNADESDGGFDPAEFDKVSRASGGEDSKPSDPSKKRSNNPGNP